MQPGLNYDKHDPKFILLGKVFKFIENENIKENVCYLFKNIFYTRFF